MLFKQAQTRNGWTHLAHCLMMFESQSGKVWVSKIFEEMMLGNVFQLIWLYAKVKACIYRPRASRLQAGFEISVCTKMDAESGCYLNDIIFRPTSRTISLQSCKLAGRSNARVPNSLANRFLSKEMLAHNYTCSPVSNVCHSKLGRSLICLRAIKSLSRGETTARKQCHQGEAK